MKINSRPWEKRGNTSDSGQMAREDPIKRKCKSASWERELLFLSPSISNELDIHHHKKCRAQQTGHREIHPPVHLRVGGVDHGSGSERAAPWAGRTFVAEDVEGEGGEGGRPSPGSAVEGISAL